MSDYVCDKCDKVFKTKQHLQRHMNSKKSCIGCLFVCKRCYKSFASKSLLDRHQHAVTLCEKYPIQCEKSELSNYIWIIQWLDENKLSQKIVNNFFKVAKSEICVKTFIQLLEVDDLDLVENYCKEKRDHRIIKILNIMTKKVELVDKEKHEKLCDFLKNGLVLELND